MTLDVPQVAAATTVIVAVLSANAGLMKLVIKSCINEALLNISKEYVTKDECRAHREDCPLHKG